VSRLGRQVAVSVIRELGVRGRSELRDGTGDLCRRWNSCAGFAPV